MISQPSFQFNRLLPIAIALLALTVVIGLAAAQIRQARQPAALIVETGAANRAELAETARWAGIGKLYTHPAQQAETLRWTALAQFYRQGYLPIVADSLRWTGLADTYLMRGQMAEQMRWTALAESYLQP